ncbi:MAG: restriction endonuclease subunit S [bacterium]
MGGKKHLRIESKNMDLKSSELTTLPQCWTWTKLGMLCDIQTGKKDVNEGSPSGEYFFFTCAASPLRSNTFSFEGEAILLPGNGANVGLVLYYDGRFEVYQRTYILNNFQIISKYLFYYMKGFWKNNLGKQYGSATNYIRLSNLTDFDVSLAPLFEQHRIVLKIEELFTKLDAGIEILKKIKAQLKRYRQAVLKYAFEGKLTEHWRQQHKDELEPASVLLERIKGDRKQKGEYKIIPPTDISNLPELPEGWIWTRLGDVQETVEMVSPKKQPTKEFTYIDIASIDNNSQKIVTYKRYSGKNAPSRARQLIKTGDILFSTVRTYLKNIAIVDAKYDKQVASTGFCVIRPRKPNSKRFYFYLSLTDAFLNPLNRIQRGTSYPAVRDSDVFEQVVPLPPAKEQYQIVEEIDRYFSAADEIEKVVELSMKQADSLRQSILKRAFEGKLVPQDPNDEPAEKLLERIKLKKSKVHNNVKGI